MGSILTATKVTKTFGGLVAVSEFDLEVEELSISSVIGAPGRDSPSTATGVSLTHAPRFTRGQAAIAASTHRTRTLR